VSKPPPRPSARVALCLRVLRFSLAAGGLVDAVLAALLALAPGLLFGRLGLPLPGEAFYLGILTVLVAMVAALYLLAAYDPMAYAGNVLVAIAGRLAAGATMIAAALGRGDLQGLYLLAAVDLAFGAVHAAAWWPIRRLRAQLW
jgi:hypothetical protein